MPQLNATSVLSIGEVARICGLAPSAIRYYEHAGLLPQPSRVSGRRRYGPKAVGQLRLLQVARDVGFTIAETRTLMTGFSATTPASIRWRTLAERKLGEIDVRMRQLRRMRALLKSCDQCRCLSLDDCARIIGSAPRSMRRGRDRVANR